MKWTVSRCFAPWSRVIQPIAMHGEYRGQFWVSPPDPPKKDDDVELTAGEKVGLVLFVLMTVPSMLGGLFLAVLLSPFVLMELIALGVVGSALWVLRRTGIARYRVDVRAHTGHKLHSRTTLLVRGDRAAVDQLVSGIASTVAGTTEAYEPKNLPPNVTVRAHRSALLRRRKRLSERRRTRPRP